MSKLKELEKRLRDEPDNLGLRVMVAGALHEAGRRDDAVDLYRSVAIAYRDQGRPQQAIMVCRSILEIAPDDGSSSELLAALVASQASARPAPGRLSSPDRLTPPPGRLSPPPSVPRPSPLPLPPPSSPSQSELGEPARRSSGDVTPLPQPLPYHIADPTALSRPKLTRVDLPPTLQEELAMFPEIEGIANAARQISASLIASSPPDVDDLLPEIETGPSDDEPTLPPRAFERSAGEDETTELRERPAGVRPPSIAPPSNAIGPLASAFFVPVPPQSRTAVLQRFRRRLVASGMTVIRRGESGHGLILVVRGQLEVSAEHGNGATVVLGAIGAGDHVGEISLLARAPSSTDIVAATESEILVLAAADFYELTGVFPGLWAELKSIAERRARDYAHRMS